jgi:hypothetical protein
VVLNGAKTFFFQFPILRPKPTYVTVARSLRVGVGVCGTLSDSPECCGSTDVLETWLAAVLRIFCHRSAGEVDVFGK